MSEIALPIRGPSSYVLNVAKSLSTKSSDTLKNYVSNAKLNNYITQLEEIGASLVSRAESVANKVDSQLENVSAIAKSIVFNGNNVIVGDFYKLSYSRQNEFLRVVMKWQYFVAPNSHVESDLESQAFMDSFKNDPSYNCEEFKELTRQYYLNALVYWKKVGEFLWNFKNYYIFG